MTTDLTTDLEPTPAQLREQARAGRKAFVASPVSRFVREMRGVIADYLRAREAGVSREDAVKGVEAVLRAVWPKQTTKFPSCDGCDNTGWRLMFCTHERRCGRELCADKHPALEHDYVVPCECDKGDPFRRSGQKRQRTPDDDLAGVGRTKKRPRGFTRFGS